MSDMVDLPNTKAVLDAIVGELEAQEIDPMPLERKAVSILRSVVHAAETGETAWTHEEHVAFRERHPELNDAGA